MSATASLHCDTDPCEATFTSTCVETWVLRIRAEDAGWLTGDEGDACPVHAPLYALETTDA